VGAGNPVTAVDLVLLLNQGRASSASGCRRPSAADSRHGRAGCGRDLPGCRTSRTWAGSRAGLPVRGRGPLRERGRRFVPWLGTWCCRKLMRRRWLA